MKKMAVINYIVLVLILSGGVGAFYFVRSDSSLQLIVGIITSISYVLWGIIHHVLQKDLHKKIVVEYLLIGMIAIVLLATVIQ